jgi:putative Holliday junction resolvase
VSPEPGRVLAIDLGQARIGLALSDPLGLTGQPLETLTRIGPRRDLRQIEDRIRRHEVTTVVVGLPLKLSGEAGSAAALARDFADRLSRRIDPIRVELWDERLTTVQAERTMISGRVRRKRRKEIVDALAASLILQSYLDARSEMPI